MLRVVPRLLEFFAIPFALYAIWLVIRRENPLTADRWARNVLIPLVGAGLACIIVALVAYGLLAPRYEGGYLPAHVEDGRIVPGRMR